MRLFIQTSYLYCALLLGIFATGAFDKEDCLRYNAENSREEAAVWTDATGLFGENERRNWEAVTLGLWTQRPARFTGTAAGLLKDQAHDTHLLWRELVSELHASSRLTSRGLRCLWSQGNGSLSPYASSAVRKESSVNVERKTLLVFLLLLLSGNVHPNPGPEVIQLQTPDECKSAKGLRFVHLNVRSLVNKIDFLRIWADVTDADVLVFTETWLKASVINDMIKIDEYNIFRCDRTKKGGGVAIYIKSNLNCSCIQSISKPNGFDLIALRLTVSVGSDIIVAGCYRPPSSSSSEICTLLAESFSEWNKHELIILGDFNWDWLSPSSDPFKEICDSLCLVQLITSVTRVNQKDLGKSTLLDLILTNASHKFTAVGVFCNDISDHCAVACVRNCKTSKMPPRFIYKRIFKHFNEQAFMHDLYNIDLGVISYMPDINLAWDYFKKVFLTICDKHAPLKRLRISGKDNPWFNDTLSTLIRQRNAAWAKAKKSNDLLDWSSYRALRNSCTNSIKCAKRDYYLSMVNENLNNPTKFWKLVKSTSGTSLSIKIPDHLIVNQNIVRGRANIAESFNNFFTAGSSYESDLGVSTELVVSDKHCPRQVFNFSPITTSQVYNALVKLDVKKSAGVDKIEPYFLKIAAGILAEPIASIFNLSLISNIIPRAWKSATVIPLFKSGDPSDPNNYRPISRLPVLAKLFESLLNDQLKQFLTDNNVLNDYQSGFRAGHSTLTAALLVTNDLINSLDCKKSCAALFVDLSKAFDSVDHNLLLQKLRSIGISEAAMKWFDNYLSERTQCVNIENYNSPFLQVKKGVPQGSILSPILFSIFINDLDSGVDSANVHLYADDSIIYTAAASINQALMNLQKAFNTIQYTLDKLKLVLNSKKTKYMIFNRTHRKDTDITISTLCGSEIERVGSYKYLGIWLDEKLAFNVHIDQLLKKLKSKLGFFYRFKNCFPYEARKKLVESTFLTIIDYGDLVYMHAASSVLRKLDSVYHAALRFVCGAEYRTHHCILYESLSWFSLYHRRNLHMYVFIAKALLGKLPSYITKFLTFYTNGYGTRSQLHLCLKVPRVFTEFGKHAFSFYAPRVWNDLQNVLKLESLPSLSTFKFILYSTFKESCKCFS